MVSMATENNNQEESFAALFEESLKHEDVKEGEIVKGSVIHVGKDHVVVDIGYKSEGLIPLDEFTDADGTVTRQGRRRRRRPPREPRERRRAVSSSRRRRPTR